MECVEEVCFDGSEQFSLLSIFNTAQLKAGFSETLNRKGTASRAPQLHHGFVQIAQFPEATDGLCSVIQPKACENGISLSVWAKILEAPTGMILNESIFLVNSGAPLYQGLTIYLSRSFLNRATGLAETKVTWIVDVGDEYWKVTAHVNTKDILEQWHNWALAWHSQHGIVGILDGRIIRMLFIILTIEVINWSMFLSGFIIYEILIFSL